MSLHLSYYMAMQHFWRDKYIDDTQFGCFYGFKFVFPVINCQYCVALLCDITGIQIASLTQLCCVQRIDVRKFCFTNLKQHYSCVLESGGRSYSPYFIDLPLHIIGHGPELVLSTCHPVIVMLSSHPGIVMYALTSQCYHPDIVMLSSYPDVVMFSSHPDIVMLSFSPDIAMLSSHPDIAMLSS
jgi:hypothetical protein